MNNFQKSFYFSQKHDQQLKVSRESVLVTPQLCSCWVSQAMGPSQVQKLLSKTLAQTSLLVNFCLSHWGVLSCQKMLFTTWRTAAGQIQRVLEKALLGCSLQCRSLCVCPFSAKDCLALPAWGWDKCQQWFFQNLLLISSIFIKYCCCPNPAGLSA